MSFPLQIFFNDINHGYIGAILKKGSFWLFLFYMAVANYCFYKKVRRTIHTAIVSYLFKSYVGITILFFEHHLLVHYLFR